MKMINTVLLRPICITFILFAIIGTSCSSEHLPEVPVAFTYEIIDEEGFSADSIRERRNFTIRFSIINHSDDTLYYKRNHEGNSDFARLFRIKDAYDLGKPFDPLLYPPAKRQGFQMILPKAILRYNFPWKYDLELLDYPSALKFGDTREDFTYNDDLLEKEEYFIQFEESFAFFSSDPRKSFVTDVIKFKHEFVIY